MHASPLAPRRTHALSRSTPAGVALALALGGAGALAAACSGLGDAEPPRAQVPDGATGAGASGPGAQATGGDAARGKKLYGELCASCHGATGEGGVGKSLTGWSKGPFELVKVIDTTMPPTDPSKCTGACAADVAAYVLDVLAKGQTCAASPLPPRRLRLLARREYEASVRALLDPQQTGASPGAACKGDLDCAFESQSCVGGACVVDPCTLRTFVYAPGGAAPKTVHVAGDFNGWAPTIAQGGWPLAYVPSKGVWVGKHAVEPGAHAYKFVLDEATWVTDPTNPAKGPDGFGGENSLLNVSCQGNSGGAGQGGLAGLSGLTKGFPVESRPKGFGFDVSADAGLVTSVHVEQYMKAAAAVAQLALADPEGLVPCKASTADAACADAMVRAVGKRAFRRSLLDDEVDRFVKLFAKAPSPEQGLAVVLRVMLASPHFLYRSEVGEPRGDGTFGLTSYEVASELSYLLWGGPPDADLTKAADAGELLTDAGLEAQARRLLADPRARPMLGTFALQWLGVEPVVSAVKSPLLFGDFTADVGARMADETSRFFAHVVLDGSHRIDELFTADYTFVDGPLAAFYGLAAPPGGGFAKASLPPSRRAGVLAHGSVLATYAHSDQTSPIRRGVMVRERLLCQELGTPPPQAGGVPAVDPTATTRERFKQHTDSEVCRTCHRHIDPIGFAFERFDAVGRERQVEGGKPIDDSGELNDAEALNAGTAVKLAGLPALGAALVDTRQVKQCFALQYYRFAHGALESHDDLCALAPIEAAFEASGYDMRELMVALVMSPGFRGRR